MSTLIKVAAARRRIREAWPLSATAARALLQLTPSRFAAFQRYCPPSYKSRGGKVHRWAAPLPPVPCGIYGTNAHDLIIHPITAPWSGRRQPRAVGTMEQCSAIVAAALREWPSLPLRAEIETIAARLVPAPVVTQTLPFTAEHQPLFPDIEPQPANAHP